MFATRVVGRTQHLPQVVERTPPAPNLSQKKPRRRGVQNAVNSPEVDKSTSSTVVKNCLPSLFSKSLVLSKTARSKRPNVRRTLDFFHPLIPNASPSWGILDSVAKMLYYCRIVRPLWGLASFFVESTAECVGFSMDARLQERMSLCDMYQHSYSKRHIYVFK